MRNPANLEHVVPKDDSGENASQRTGSCLVVLLLGGVSLSHALTTLRLTGIARPRAAILLLMKIPDQAKSLLNFEFAHGRTR